MVSFQCISI